jgi:hypothetical protein
VFVIEKERKGSIVFPLHTTPPFIDNDKTPARINRFAAFACAALFCSLQLPGRAS